LTIRLGSLKRVTLRDVWTHEAHVFTPWLAEHLDDLAEALGLDLELEGREVGVGGFSVDLLARDLGSDDPVVIECQFGKTDHDHLGKLITYASGLGAGKLVWVCETMREEHRQALDWLNAHTDEDIHVFGVELEMLQIDDSAPACHFKLTVMPNEWQKMQKRRAAGTVGAKGERYLAYFQALVDELREQHAFTKVRIAHPQNWSQFSAGISGMHYRASFTKDDRVGAELNFGTPRADLNRFMFDSLLREREAIEGEVGQPLEWDPIEGRNACRIALYREGSIEGPPDDLDRLHVWHVESLLKLRRALDKRLRPIHGEYSARRGDGL